MHSEGKTMENKLVSVIVPVYNVETYLKRCITSLLAQSYANTEIILVWSMTDPLTRAERSVIIMPLPIRR